MLTVAVLPGYWKVRFFLEDTHVLSRRDCLQTRVLLITQKCHLIFHFYNLQYRDVFSIMIMSSGHNDRADRSTVQQTRLH